MLTFTPVNSMSFYTCGLCGISAQAPVAAYDADGVPLVDDEGLPVLVDDEPAASAEMQQHVADAHPGA